jgi:hypothetical protein
MDNVEFDREPPANLTTMVMAFGGWIDAGRAATGALRHLASDLQAARVARITAEEFFVFTQERPEVRLRADGGRDIHWPRSEFFAWHGGDGRDGIGRPMQRVGGSGQPTLTRLPRGPRLPSVSGGTRLDGRLARPGRKPRGST